ncbi:protein NRT1/ PTR FAMILY 1.2-like [Arachis duranensis]|uniref:Protein NRT1/ PTR FAMILY 1.2-like n=1 Tax=Arachis duranensis TaxID=130453 RepID=A0A9C6TFR4_ARADU|nr:protein NRT1/ PTR FAMILY 1.2-like [Arachis duranensis]
MEISIDQEKSTQQVTSKKGGVRTMPFIIANETFEKVASVGLHINMVLYLLYEYHFDPATGAIIIFLWNAMSNFMPIFGAFLSDSLLGRFRVIAGGTLMELLGLVVLWLTAIIRRARPPECHAQACPTPTPPQLLLLISSLALTALGAGGIRPCSIAFGADQINHPENPQNERNMKSFFNWYYVSVGISVMVAVIFIVYIQAKYGWIVGFGIPVGLMIVSATVFFLGSLLYVKVKPNKSLFTGFAQVIAAAWKNRHLALPPNNSETSWYFKNGSNLVEPTNKARYLNKACMIKNRERELDSDGIPVDPWNLCTVRQVEELKAIIKVLPMWSTGIIVATITSQHSFSVVQAGSMDRHLFGLELPPTSFSVFLILSLTIWVAIYDRLLIPLLKSRALTLKHRMGAGLVLSCLAMVVAALVERKRRNEAIKEGFIDNPKGVVHMSAMWLVPQYCLTGLAEALNAIGQIEFYYSQFPKTMSSIAVALFYLGLGMGNLVASIIVKVVNVGTRRSNGVSWLSTNLNRGHYDYYYALLSILSFINVLYFLLCSWIYGNTQDINNWDDEQEADHDIHKI